MVTDCPSKSICPSSKGWIPAMHLISVDLPAPLSSTSAVTSPAWTSMSTLRRTWTAPEALVDPAQGQQRGALLSLDGVGHPLMPFSSQAFFSAEVVQSL